MSDFSPADGQFEERVRASFARQGAMAHLGARLTLVRAGYVEIEVPYRLEVSQQHGFFHAGILATVADSAGGYAGYSLFPADAAVLSVEFKLNLMAPADGELVIASGQVVKHGRTLTICQIDAHVTKAGVRTHCATGLQTLICLRGKSGVTG